MSKELTQEEQAKERGCTFIVLALIALAWIIFGSGPGPATKQKCWDRYRSLGGTYVNMCERGVDHDEILASYYGNIGR